MKKKKRSSELDSDPVRRRLDGGPQAPRRGDPFFQGPGDGGGGSDAEEGREDPRLLEGGGLGSIFFFFEFLSFSF